MTKARILADFISASATFSASLSRFFLSISILSNLNTLKPRYTMRGYWREERELWTCVRNMMKTKNVNYDDDGNNDDDALLPLTRPNEKLFTSNGRHYSVGGTNSKLRPLILSTRGRSNRSKVKRFVFNRMTIDSWYKSSNIDQD